MCVCQKSSIRSLCVCPAVEKKSKPNYKLQDRRLALCCRYAASAAATFRHFLFSCAQWVELLLLLSLAHFHVLSSALPISCASTNPHLTHRAPTLFRCLVCVRFFSIFSLQLSFSFTLDSSLFCFACVCVLLVFVYGPSQFRFQMPCFSATAAVKRFEKLFNMFRSMCVSVLHKTYCSDNEIVWNPQQQV